MADNPEQAWHKIPLTRDQVAEGVITQVQFAFTETYLAHGAPKDVALLISDTPNHIGDPNNTCLYFTPLASRLCADLIQQYGGAQPYPEPSPSESSHLAGDMAYLSEERERIARHERSDSY